jgi:hypothetical protein
MTRSYHPGLGGLTIGQAFEDGDHDVVRVVAVDPAMHFVELESPVGAMSVDSIEHFTSTHWPLAG